MPKHSPGHTALILALTAMATLICTACTERASEPANHTDPVDSAQAPDYSPEIRINDPDNQGLSLDEAVEAARQDLAVRLDEPVEQITIADARHVTWGNGSLGCPAQGMMYTQALVPGYYIRLHAASTDHDYHAGRDGEPFFCPAERSLRPPPDRRGSLE